MIYKKKRIISNISRDLKQNNIWKQHHKKQQNINKSYRKISGSEAIVRCLIEEDVKIIYGYPGGAIMPVYDELYKYQDKIHHVLTRHEQGATHSAQGFARISGKVGVALQLLALELPI